MVDGELQIIDKGATSCHRLRQTLHLPGHLPMVVYPSANLQTACVEQLIMFYTTASSNALEAHRPGLQRDYLRDSSAVDAARCVVVLPLSNPQAVCHSQLLPLCHPVPT